MFFCLLSLFRVCMPLTLNILDHIYIYFSFLIFIVLSTYVTKKVVERSIKSKPFQLKNFQHCSDDFEKISLMSMLYEHELIDKLTVQTNKEDNNKQKLGGGGGGGKKKSKKRKKRRKSEEKHDEL